MRTESRPTSDAYIVLAGQRAELAVRRRTPVRACTPIGQKTRLSAQRTYTHWQITAGNARTLPVDLPRCGVRMAKTSRQIRYNANRPGRSWARFSRYRKERVLNAVLVNAVLVNALLFDVGNTGGMRLGDDTMCRGTERMSG